MACDEGNKVCGLVGSFCFVCGVVFFHFILNLLVRCLVLFL